MYLRDTMFERTDCVNMVPHLSLHWIYQAAIVQARFDRDSNSGDSASFVLLKTSLKMLKRRWSVAGMPTRSLSSSRLSCIGVNLSPRTIPTILGSQGGNEFLLTQIGSRHIAFLIPKLPRDAPASMFPSLSLLAHRLSPVQHCTNPEVCILAPGQPMLAKAVRVHNAYPNNQDSTLRVNMFGEERGQEAIPTVILNRCPWVAKIGSEELVRIFCGTKTKVAARDMASA